MIRAFPEANVLSADRNELTTDQLDSIAGGTQAAPLPAGQPKAEGLSHPPVSIIAILIGL